MLLTATARWIVREAPVPLLISRAHASARLLVDLLAQRPVVSVSAAAAAIGRTFQATNQGFATLTRLRLIEPDPSKRRHRVFMATPVLDALDARGRG